MGKIYGDSLVLAGVAVTASAAEMNVNAAVVAGTSSASKTAVLGATKNLDVLALPVGGLAIGPAAGTPTTMSALEMNSLTDQIASVTQVSTPASGTNGTQFTFKNAAGVAVSSVRFIEAYISDINGLPVTAITSFAALTNGALDVIVTGKIYNCITTAAGLLGITFTGTANTRYVTFVLPSGKLVTSAAIVIS